MDTISLSDARAHLGALLDRVEAGESIAISRRGKPVAQLTALAPARTAIDAAALRAVTATMRAAEEAAADLVRTMRDADRY